MEVNHLYEDLYEAVYGVFSSRQFDYVDDQALVDFAPLTTAFISTYAGHGLTKGKVFIPDREVGALLSFAHRLQSGEHTKKLQGELAAYFDEAPDLLV